MYRHTEDFAWYAKWMSLDEAPDRNHEVLRKRGDEADRLLKEITEDLRFSADTLEQLAQILDHEYCYLKTSGDAEDQQGTTKRALEKSWTSRLVTRLSQCLFQSIYPESFYERELQFRGLFSALLLQSAHGIRGWQVEYDNEIRTLREKSHKDLQWLLVPSSTTISKEAFRKYQCSYLLAAIAEYSKKFDREEKLYITVLDRAMKLTLAGGSLAVATAVSVGQGDLIAVIQALDQSFRPLRQEPSDRSKVIFMLHELARMALAMELKARVITNLTDADKHKEAMYEFEYKALASWILNTILSLLEEDRLEEYVTHPTTAFQDFRAFVGRGPPSFGEYHYLYGLLDCATQIGRIMKGEAVVKALLDRIRRIMTSKTDPGIRWKAIEFLLITELWDDSLDTNDPSETKIIRSCLTEESSHILTPSSRMPSNSTTHSALALPQTPTLKPTTFKENPLDFPIIQINSTASFCQIPFDRGRLKTNSKKYYTAGLSPDCHSAFFLGNSELVVCPLESFPFIKREEIKFRKTPCDTSDFSVARATITNQFLALLTKGRHNVVTVYRHRPFRPANYEVGFQLFEDWYPTCLTMHESPNQTFIAVGGCVAGVSSVRIFKLAEISSDGWALIPHLSHDTEATHLLTYPLANDRPKVINFSADGKRLMVLTKNNRVLIWPLSGTCSPLNAPFEIQKTYEVGINARGIESITLFHTPSQNPYIFCTTSPSARRQSHGCEWPFISPISSSSTPSKVPEELQHPFSELGKSLPMLAGAVAEGSALAAMLDCGGRITVSALGASVRGGVRPVRGCVRLERAVRLRRGGGPLFGCEMLRFSAVEKGVELWAVDTKGKVVRKGFGE